MNLKITRRRVAMISACTAIVAICGLNIARFLAGTTPNTLVDNVSSQQEEFRAVVRTMECQLGSDRTRPPLPAMPTGVYPEAQEVRRYALKIGWLFPPTDEDARWVLRVIASHPDEAARIYVINSLPAFVTSVPPYQRLESQAGPELEHEVFLKIVELLKHPQANRQADYQDLMIGACCSARLWRDPHIRAVIEERCKLLRATPDEFERRRGLLDPCLDEMHGSSMSARAIPP